MTSIHRLFYDQHGVLRPLAYYMLYPLLIILIALVLIGLLALERFAGTTLAMVILIPLAIGSAVAVYYLENATRAAYQQESTQAADDRYT